MKTFDEYLGEAQQFNKEFDFEQGPDESDSEYQRNKQYIQQVALRNKVKLVFGKSKMGISTVTLTGDKDAVTKTFNAVM